MALLFCFSCFCLFRTLKAFPAAVVILHTVVLRHGATLILLQVLAEEAEAIPEAGEAARIGSLTHHFFYCFIILYLYTLKQLISFLLVCFLFSAYAGKERIFIRDASKPLNEKEAILILPGFGSRVQGTQKIADFFFNKEYDVYIPDYIARKSINNCVQNLDRFMTGGSVHSNNSAVVVFFSPAREYRM